MTSRHGRLDIDRVIAHSSEQKSFLESSYNEDGIVQLSIFRDGLRLSQKAEIARPCEPEIFVGIERRVLLPGFCVAGSQLGCEVVSKSASLFSTSRVAHRVVRTRNPNLSKMRVSTLSSCLWISNDNFHSWHNLSTFHQRQTMRCSFPDQCHSIVSQSTSIDIDC